MSFQRIDPADIDFFRPPEYCSWMLSMSPQAVAANEATAPANKISNMIFIV